MVSSQISASVSISITACLGKLSRICNSVFVGTPYVAHETTQQPSEASLLSYGVYIVMHWIKYVVQGH